MTENPDQYRHDLFDALDISVRFVEKSLNTLKFSRGIIQNPGTKVTSEQLEEFNKICDKEIKEITEIFSVDIAKWQNNVTDFVIKMSLSD